MTKPSVDEIKDIITKCDLIYGKLWGEDGFAKDERFYELNFKADLDIPTNYERDAVVVPTARDMVDAFVDNIDIQNARVQVNKKGTSNKSKEAQEMERKLYLGLIHRTNVENQISPWRQCAKHLALHGLAVFKTMWDADNWMIAPQKNKGESDDAYAARIDQWRRDTHFSLPILIQSVHPANIIPDPYQGGKLYVIERHKRLVFDAKRMWGHWKNDNNKKDDEEVEYISYWDGIYRCDLVDNQPVLKIRGGVVKHGYGFIPYTLIESGLGNLSKDASPSMRYVGLLRYMFDMLVSESKNYTNNDILVKWETMLGGYITGADAESVAKIKQNYSEWFPVGDKDVKFNKWEREMPTAESRAHLATTRDYIDSHAGPRSVRGLSEENVRSGAHERYRVSQASMRYAYATPAFQNGTSRVLGKCAMLVKNKIPGDFRIWARTPSDEIDVLIKKDRLREPFAPYVEFSPISVEDEYRKQDAMVNLVQAGIYTPEFTWTQMNNVDPEKMAKDVKKAQLRKSPSYLQAQDQTMAMMYQQAVQQAGLIPMQRTEQEMATGNIDVNQRGNVPPIPDMAMPGSVQDIQNQINQRRQQMSSGIVTQGRGGGGNR